MEPEVMNRNIQTQIDELTPIWTATDEVLDDWKGEGCLQLPILMGMLAVKFNWSDKQMRENDPFVRRYLRHHDKWHVTRGAHGGIMKLSDKQKKDAEKEAKDLARKQVEAAVAAKAAQLAAASVAATNPVVVQVDSSVDEDDEDDLDLTSA
jgi:hypothetical protein